MYKYKPVIRSKRGGVKVTLDSGPDGMKLVAGQLQWQVPVDAKESRISVIMSVEDASGQQIYHTFMLTVR